VGNAPNQVKYNGESNAFDYWRWNGRGIKGKKIKTLCMRKAIFEELGCQETRCEVGLV
jgi:hypothetical protein